MAALETGGPSGAIRGFTSVYFNATVCALVCVGGLVGGHEGLRLLIFPLAVLEPCVFFFRGVASHPVPGKAKHSLCTQMLTDVPRSTAQLPLELETRDANTREGEQHLAFPAALLWRQLFLARTKHSANTAAPSKKRPRPLAVDHRTAADVL